MAEENKTPTEEKKKIDAKPLPVDKEKARAIEQGKASADEKPKAEDAKPEEKSTEKKEEKKESPKKETKQAPKVKKEEAVARGSSLPISKKHAMYICAYIKNKDIDSSIEALTKVTKLKKAIPFKGEIPHRKGDMMSGRYPVKAAGYFINLLKALKGNAIVNGLELEKTRIASGSASWARRPMKAGGAQAKRTNVILIAREVTGGKKK